jgi:hypothetical protein
MLRYKPAQIRFISEVTDRAPHLEYFAVSWEEHLHPWKQIDGEWVPCDRAEFPFYRELRKKLHLFEMYH